MESQGPPVSLVIEVDRNAEVSIVRCHGMIVSGLADYLDTVAGKLIPQSQLVILDLADVQWIDSKGVATLAGLFQLGATSGCHLKLINLHKSLSERPGLQSLQHRFPHFADHRTLTA